MDEATKERFKWKFYQLAVVLNIVILCIAVGVIAFFMGPENYKYLLSALFFIAALLIFIYFLGKYKAAKAWLEKNG